MLPHDLAEPLMKKAHGLFPWIIEQLLRLGADAFRRLFKFWSIDIRLGAGLLLREVVTDGIGNDKIAIDRTNSFI